LALAKNKQTDLKPRLLNPIIELLYPLIQAEAIMSGKHVHVEYGANVELPLDEKEIRQLILNLSMNGLEAMEPGGILRIETGTDPEAGEVVLTIADQGRGIREEDLEKLGRPFFTTKEHGTGLGLAVCYSIAARHQAAIEVESSGEGTTFRIRFRQGKA
jgi:signal transduction histidine kinase